MCSKTWYSTDERRSIRTCRSSGVNRSPFRNLSRSLPDARQECHVGERRTIEGYAVEEWRRWTKEYPVVTNPSSWFADWLREKDWRQGSEQRPTYIWQLFSSWCEIHRSILPVHRDVHLTRFHSIDSLDRPSRQRYNRRDWPEPIGSNHR